MAAGRSVRSVTFADPPTTESPISTPGAPEDSPQHTPDLQSSHHQIRSANKASIWELPGLDKTTFYAAALYLNAAGGVLKARPWYGVVKTPESTRNFLDHLADCFALSKGEDARDHVSATAMVRNDQRKKITLYIAKNKSDKGEPGQSPASEESGTAETNPNEEFAKLLVGWFNELAQDIGAKDTDDPYKAYQHIFYEMCKFTKSRLDYYSQKVSETKIDVLDHDVEFEVGAEHLPAWTEAKTLIQNCSDYELVKSCSTDPGEGTIYLLEENARLAGSVRKSHGFRILTHKVERVPPNEGVKKKTDWPNLAQVVKWINYLGRLFAAFVGFYRFCRDQNQSGWHFNHVLLPSEEHDWDGDVYMQKVQSWTADFGQTVARNTSIESRMEDVVRRSGNKARIHCEMQLMMYFLQPDVEQCLDYFGCSKKSCWLCWHMILQDAKHSMKQPHRKLYPRWAFPFEFSSSQAAVSEGLRAVYNAMLRLIQDSIIRKVPITFLERDPETSVRQTPLDTALLLARPIAAPGKLWSRVVPALHLPADGNPGDLLETEIYAYKYDQSDILSSMMTNVSIGGQDLVFAFQLLTKPTALSPEPGINEVQTAFWDSTHFYSIQKASLTGYTMYYRSAPQLLPENPQIRSIWENVHGEELELSPWRGDVFIFHHARFGNLRSASTDLEFSPVNGLECAIALENLFRKKGAQYFSETAEHSHEQATTKRERYQELMQMVGRLEELQQRAEERIANDPYVMQPRNQRR